MPAKSKQAKLVTDQIEALAKLAGIMEKALRNTGHAEFFVPPFTGELPPSFGGAGTPWEGDTLDIDRINAFNRQELEAQFRLAVADPAEAGVVGDLIAILVQGDFLGQLERAYRARHMTSVRSKVHAAARQRGHGNVNGPLLLGMTNYIKQLLKLASG